MFSCSKKLIKCVKCLILFLFFLQGTVANKFYVHNDVFRYQDEVFGDSDSEPPEGETMSSSIFFSWLPFHLLYKYDPSDLSVIWLKIN